ncbi:MAG: argininosuccinate lyase [Verrucomicrobiae bacterium]|nr:argininosuccinate lyase [Verrucomicrobiae bacterium]
MKNQPISRSGRFSKGPSKETAEFTESISFDWRLWRHDIMGSMAHAIMLNKIGVLTKTELEEILKHLEAIGNEIETGKFNWNPELEDVHMNIEAELTRRTPAGAKLHTARSRNDQVSLDMRLWLRDEIIDLCIEIRSFQKTLIEVAEKNLHVIIPGYTHLQRAQPVLLAHHMLAYVEMLDRDYDRFCDCFYRANVCPLGAGAIAGTTIPIDRELTARLLGFVDSNSRPRLTTNSMDAVSDRDFFLEFCSAAAIHAVHLSRFAEDIVLWSTSEFNFIRLSDEFTTGSSLMPQKKNPDVAELIRGKSARVIGNLTSLLTLLKGLPMTYNRDLQEDKERLFDTADTVKSCVRIFTIMIRDATFNEDVCKRAASDPLLLATDLADYLVKKGMPFRNAHHIVGSLVSLAEKKHTSLDKLSIEEFKSVCPQIENDVYDVFNLDKAMNRRNIAGAPAVRQVKKEIVRWKKNLSE